MISTDVSALSNRPRQFRKVASVELNPVNHVLSGSNFLIDFTIFSPYAIRSLATPRAQELEFGCADSPTFKEIPGEVAHGYSYAGQHQELSTFAVVGMTHL